MNKNVLVKQISARHFAEKVSYRALEKNGGARVTFRDGGLETSIREDCWGAHEHELSKKRCGKEQGPSFSDLLRGRADGDGLEAVL